MFLSESRSCPFPCYSFGKLYEIRIAISIHDFLATVLPHPFKHYPRSPTKKPAENGGFGLIKLVLQVYQSTLNLPTRSINCSA